MARFTVALCLVTFLGTGPAYGLEGHYRVSEFGNGNQIWFEANFYDERVPDEDQFYQVVPKTGAFFNDAVNRTDNTGGYLRFDFDLTETAGAGGTWYFWGREINPNNQSDYLFVEGHPGDDPIPFDEDPIPGGEGTFGNDKRIFEENVGTDGNFAWWGGGGSHEEAHTKELQDGENSMFIFHRQGNDTVFWDVFMWTDDPNYVASDGDYLAATVIGGDFAECPAEGDTHCHSITILNPDGDKVEEAQDNRTGTYKVTIEDTDDSGDDGLYFLTADNGVDQTTVFGSTDWELIRYFERA